jgi:hypothetical protein
VDNSDPCKKNRELHRVELPRSIKGMTHSNRVNQLAETFLLDFNKWLAVMEFLLFISFGDIVREVGIFFISMVNGAWKKFCVLFNRM